MKNKMLWFCKNGSAGFIDCLVEAMHSYYAARGHYPNHALANELQIASYCSKHRINWTRSPLSFERGDVFPGPIVVEISHGLTPNHILLEEK